MELTADQQRTALAAPCMPLRFLVQPEFRHVSRAQMAGFSDAAIFNRLMNLVWTLREPEVVALLTPDENVYLNEFNLIFEALPWQPIESHPHISEVADDEMSKLVPSAARLLQSLARHI